VVEYSNTWWKSSINFHKKLKKFD